MFVCVGLLRYNCEEIWREFRNAVVQRAPCNVRVKDYSRMFLASPQALPCDRVSTTDVHTHTTMHHHRLLLAACVKHVLARQLLFWSKTREIVHSYSAITRRFCTLEDTLVGYMFNDLIWCGQKEKHRGEAKNSLAENVNRQ